MPALIQNTPSFLIPKELFKEEKMKEYGYIMFPKNQWEFFGKDDLNTFFLLYPKPKEEDTIHEITVLYNNFQEQYAAQTQAICFNVYEDGLNLLVLKDKNIVYTGFFNIQAKEDAVYHLANVTQQFFDDISQITFYYQNISDKVFQFLDKYFEMKKLL